MSNILVVQGGEVQVRPRFRWQVVFQVASPRSHVPQPIFATAPPAHAQCLFQTLQRLGCERQRSKKLALPAPRRVIRQTVDLGEDAPRANVT